MPDRYGIIFTSRAADDLVEIHSFISKTSPQNANLVVDRIIREIDSLDKLPHRYSRFIGIPPLSQPMRRMLVYPYHVYYEVEDRRLAVFILAVQHGAREFPPHF